MVYVSISLIHSAVSTFFVALISSRYGNFYVLRQSSSFFFRGEDNQALYIQDIAYPMKFLLFLEFFLSHMYLFCLES